MTPFLQGETQISPSTVDIVETFQHKDDNEMDFAEAKGQENLKRALEMAGAGAHKSGISGFATNGHVPHASGLV